MKLSPTPGRAPNTTPDRRAELLAAFERSGLSAAGFARQHGIRSGTFYVWRRQRRRTAKRPPEFVQIEVAQPPTPVELAIELGPHARLHLNSERQIALAAQLLQALNSRRPC